MNQAWSQQKLLSQDLKLVKTGFQTCLKSTQVIHLDAVEDDLVLLLFRLWSATLENLKTEDDDSTDGPRKSEFCRKFLSGIWRDETPKWDLDREDDDESMGSLPEMKWRFSQKGKNLVHTSRMSQQLSQRSLQIIGNFSIYPATDCASRCLQYIHN